MQRLQHGVRLLARLDEAALRQRVVVGDEGLALRRGLALGVRDRGVEVVALLVLELFVREDSRDVLVRRRVDL